MLGDVVGLREWVNGVAGKLREFGLTGVIAFRSGCPIASKRSSCSLPVRGKATLQIPRFTCLYLCRDR